MVLPWMVLQRCAQVVLQSENVFRENTNWVRYFWKSQNSVSSLFPTPIFNNEENIGYPMIILSERGSLIFLVSFPPLTFSWLPKVNDSFFIQHWESRLQPGFYLESPRIKDLRILCAICKSVNLCKDWLPIVTFWYASAAAAPITEPIRSRYVQDRSC